MGDTLYLYARNLFLRGIKKKNFGQIMYTRTFCCHIFYAMLYYCVIGDF